MTKTVTTVFKTPEEATKARKNQRDKVFRIDDPDAKEPAFVLAPGSVVQAIGIYGREVLRISATSRLVEAKRSLKTEVKELLEKLQANGLRSGEGKTIVQELSKIINKSGDKLSTETSVTDVPVDETTTTEQTAEDGEEASSDPVHSLISDEVPPPVPEEILPEVPAEASA